MRVLFKTFALATFALPLSSCVTSRVSEPELPIELSENYSVTSQDSNMPARWWKSFGDEELNALIEEALSGNLGLRQAAARLEQAEALARQAGAERIPAVSAEASARRGRVAANTPAGVQITDTVNRFGLDLAATYELDLWGRVAASTRAAARDADASRLDLETAAMTLVAQVADLWYALGALSAQIELLDEQIEKSSKQLELVELRFNTGHSDALAVWQQRGQLAALEALRPNLTSSRATVRHQLGVLLGRSPQAFRNQQGTAPPELPPLPETGIPSDLVNNRPDVRAAVERLRASDERVAAAVANRFPALRLSASAGYSADEMSALFDNWIWNIAGNLLTPIIDGGRRRAEVDRARAALDELVGRYAETLLNAVREVEDALVEESGQLDLIESQQGQLAIAGSTYDQALSRYTKGVGDYLAVLRAFEERQRIERALVDTRRGLVSRRIGLHRALGGDFSSEAMAVDE